MATAIADAAHAQAPQRRALVVVLIGLPGAGKSTLAAALVGRFGLMRVCRDRIRAAMFPGCGDGFAEKRAAFRSALLAVEIHCALGRACVLDGMTLARERDRRRVLALLTRYRALAVPIHLDCPIELARERLARNDSEHPAVDRVPGLVDLVARRFEFPEDAFRIDARQSAEQVAAQATALVEARGRQVGVLRRT